MRAKKSLGQNFLQDAEIIRRIVDSLSITDEDVVVEIGPGLGALTRGLLEKAQRVIAIEFDRDMLLPLKLEFGSCANFELLNADALSVDLVEVVDGAKGKLAANLPYNISTPILQRLIQQRNLFSELVLMFQREVVERITAKPGGRERGFLSVLVESAFETEYLFDVPPAAFKPVPKVWSAVVRLTPKPAFTGDELAFRQLVSLAFTQKRKNLLNNLRPTIDGADGVLHIAGIDGRRRAETLSLDEWERLSKTLSDKKMTG